jgi:hypothetical protein
MSTQPNDAVGVIALQHGLSNDSHVELGLTKREHFAALAMRGPLANPVYHNPNEKHKMVKVSDLADTAVIYADALIESLSK